MKDRVDHNAGDNEGMDAQQAQHERGDKKKHASDDALAWSKGERKEQNDKQNDEECHGENW